ncbi:MAG: BatA domain-containing protein [Flavobacteriaceae bacterium]|nr:BatA domain-containing protein [Flavobacteriaceae bacterium]
MQFNNPNILYALFALIIPILVHLFQLRKFQKTAFTNVKFLKELIVQTRKSSQLKKWLILSTRLLILTCIVLAFAEPSFDTNKAAVQETETVFYIDNSFSTQEKGPKGELLKVSVQELINSYPNDKKVSVITNTHTFKNKSINTIKNDLINLEYTPNQLDYKTVSLKANQLFSKNKNILKRLICISDFQKNNSLDSSYFNTKYQTTLVQTLPVSKSNISIDSAYFIKPNATETQLKVLVSKQYSTLKNIPIALYNNDSLISKTTVDLTNSKNSVLFHLPSKNSLNLKVELLDASSTSDNVLYLTRKETSKQNILAIGNRKNNSFLSKIFTENEFLFNQQESNSIDYSNFDQQHLIILNELENLSVALIKNISNFTKNGGTILCIPSEKIDMKNYNSLVYTYNSINENETRLTKINFDHPIFSSVFEKKIKNFQYPFFKKHYTLKNYESTILSLENGGPLLVRIANNYIFSAPLNSINTNFKQAPLIVPTLYNIAKSTLKNNIPYYHINTENNIDFELKIKKDDVLSISKNNVDFIPIQQIKANKVSIQTTNQPAIAGIYSLKNKQNLTGHTIAFNYPNSESIRTYHAISTLENNNIKTATSVTDTLAEINSTSQIGTLWKWFVIFAILFLIVELLILKYFK